MEDDKLSTETFLVLCYKSGLSRIDLEDLTVGMCLDYIEEYLDLQRPKDTIRYATQNDFDSF